MTIREEIEQLKKEQNAVILAHYYVRPEVQEIADYVGDSFYLSKVAVGLKEKTIVFCGVSFMGESAKILNPEKTVLMPDMAADCPMAHMASAETIEKIRSEYDDLAVVCYINSTAELKRHSDVCVTSSNAVKIVKALPNKNIFFIPDRNLAHYIAGLVPEKNFIYNEGFCIVHEYMEVEEIKAAKEVLADENASQEEVDAAEKAVQAAQKALVEKETPKPEAPVKKDELKAAVEDATKVVGDKEQYTEESLAALQSAIDKANAVLDNPEATQAEIDAAVKAVKEAKEALKVKEDKKDDNNKGDDKKDDDKKDDNKKDDSNSGTSNNGSSNGGSNNNGSSNTGSTNTGSGNKGTTSTGSTTSHAVKTGDTTNVVTWLFALAASAAAGLGVVKRKKED